jgi:hypothetical protein
MLRGQTKYEVGQFMADRNSLALFPAHGVGTDKALPIHLETRTDIGWVTETHGTCG